MTARELAALLRARKCGKGKWVAKCVAHPDRTPSLSIAEGRKGVVLKCMSAGCETKAILDVLGLQWSDLFHGAPDAERKGRLAAERKLDRLDRKLGLVLWLLAIDKGKERYWESARRRIVAEMEPLWWELMPDREKFDRGREFEIKDYRNKRLDWLRERGKHNAQGLPAQGLLTGTRSDRAGDDSPMDAQEVRPNGLHDPPPPIQRGGVHEGRTEDGRHRGYVVGGD